MTVLTIEERLATIRDFVPRLRQLVAGLTAEQLTTPYNAPEWTVAQNVHHLVDSHTHAYLRTKHILTKHEPQLVGYDQDEFAKFPDAKDANIEVSLQILEGLHVRWVRTFETVTDWSKKGYHLEMQKDVSLDDILSTYHNHCGAHYRQIQEVLDKMP